MYAGSKLPPIIRHVLCVTVTSIADSGRLYRSLRCCDNEVIAVYSSLIMTFVLSSATIGEALCTRSLASSFGPLPFENALLK